ncbi:MAG: FAD-dependent oxidoreductase [Desulfobacterales bacterium]|nr:FAD-dependent oxidoreductase [Desulfobacterales bacterium]MBF0395676.1 FAD-dependent oxidoreductase [Desulfobacterales bacterium]
MKRAKDRLHRVIVIGATPAGIAAVNKLGELGIPVALVDENTDIDNKLSNWKFPSGMPFNHGHRPGLIRILRNPVIECLMPAKVTQIEHNPQGFHVTLKRDETFIDSERCILCGKCVNNCIVLNEEGKKPIYFNSRRSLPGAAVIDKRKKPLCQANCPLGVNAQGYIALVKAGKFKQALELIRKDNVLPGICGRICTRSCEVNCRRGEIDEPVAIRDIKRFVYDHTWDAGEKITTQRKEKIAVIGSGPAGLAAAADLARFGFQVTIFEKEKEAGGLLRYGIGAHRLPKEVVDGEIEYIKKLGVNILTAHPINVSSDLEKLKEEFDAVIVATGAGIDKKLNITGENLDGIYGCVSLLSKLYKDEIKKLNENIAVIGDGNSAFDLARILVRLGAKVTIISWFSHDMIPASKEEIHAALEERIIIKDSIQVVEFIGDNGKLQKIKVAPTMPGPPDKNGICWPIIIPEAENIELDFSMAVVAIGQHSENLKLSGIYLAGDRSTGPSSVVYAMASGRACAKNIYRDICKTEPDSGVCILRPENKDFTPIPIDIPSISRQKMPERQIVARTNNFSEVALGFTEIQAIAEAERCLQCGGCCECLSCLEECGEVGAINHGEDSSELVEHCGVIIVADPNKAPEISGEDVISAYGDKNGESDLYEMIIRGYAAAGSAMTLLTQTSHRPKGHVVSFASPAESLLPDIRIGVFVCKCNSSIGWLDGMTEYVQKIKEFKDVVYTEVLNSACIADSVSHILWTIREKGITRIVLASCICCPLNFVCSACTDQRSRLKSLLFGGTGINRSMVETCNIRGEALRLTKKEPEKAMELFRGLINRSIKRARRLKNLQTVARNYNLAIAVIGESEASLNSALTLAKSGIEVLLYGSFDKKSISYPNIHYFKDFLVTALGGTAGNFQLYVEAGEKKQVIEVGAVIIDESYRKKMKYVHKQGVENMEFSMQRHGISGIPFFYPGATSISGLYLCEPIERLNLKTEMGVSAAVQAASVMPRGPRQSKGYTVIVDEGLCRGCGRCFKVCHYRAISFHENKVGGWCAMVDEALCKGCGNCISVCPSNAADSPYRDQTYLENALYELLM